MYRNRLMIGGARLKLDGGGLRVPAWQSADKDGGDNRRSWFTSRLMNGYFGGYDFERVGQKSSETNFGAGRATAYLDTGWSDVAIENVWEGNLGLAAMGCVCVSPNSGWEHNLALYPEHWDPIKVLVIWYIGNPSRSESVPYVGLPHSHVVGNPWTSRMEVVGRRVKAWENSSGSFVLAYEGIVPPDMVGSTKQGITHDVPLAYRPVWKTTVPADHWLDPNWRDELDSWEAHPNYGITEGAQEANFKVRPILHFSDEPAGTLGPELARDTDFLDGLGDWVAEDASWSVDSSTANYHRACAYADMADSGSPFTSGYLRQTLTQPLVAGKTYRLTFGLYGANDPPRPYSHTHGAPADTIFGTVTCSVFDGSFSYGPTPAVKTQSGYTYDFVASGPHDTIEFLAQSEDDGGTHKLFNRVHFVSLREFTAL